MINAEELKALDKMVELIEAKNKAMDNMVYNEMGKSINITLPFVKVNAEKLRNWVLLCIKLENIDKSDLVECAVRKKFADKDNEISKLKAELEELKKNAIVPKFNFGDTIFAVVTYIDNIDKTVIESGIVQKIECDKNQIKYWCDNGRIYWEDECEKLFATEQEAQQKLKKLEEK